MNTEILYNLGVITYSRMLYLNMLINIWQIYETLDFKSERKKAREIAAIVNVSEQSIRTILSNGKPEFLKN